MTHDKAIQEAKNWLSEMANLAVAPWKEHHRRRYEVLKHLIKVAEKAVRQETAFKERRKEVKDMRRRIPLELAKTKTGKNDVKLGSVEWQRKIIREELKELELKNKN